MFYIGWESIPGDVNVTVRRLAHLRSKALSSSSPPKQNRQLQNQIESPNMATPPSSTVQTLLRYTYRANMVFFAGFGTWYMLKGLGRGQEQDIAALMHQDEKVNKDTK